MDKNTRLTLNGRGKRNGAQNVRAGRKEKRIKKMEIGEKKKESKVID